MIIFKNNTGNKSKQELIDSFAVRTKPFKLIFQEIASSNSDKPEQNYLVIGQRGAGKTTLLYRLKYEIDDKLGKKWGLLPVMLNEEQYNLAELLDLWQYIAELLEDQGYFPSISSKIAEVKGGKFQEDEAFNILEKHLRDAKKKLIIFIENIDAFFKKIGTSGQKRLREILTTSHNIRLIASSTSYFEGIMDYSMPFYEFFKIIELKGLSLQESRDLLLSIGEQYGDKEKIKAVLEKSTKRLESLRRLTGGVPRTISYLFEIFLGTENGKAVKDLYKLLDDLTALYKSEMDQLSPLQQKVIDAMARNWDAIGVKDIVAKTRIESKQVSSILGSLEKNQFIEVINTKSKNNLYRIRERFMNIWYLMRFGRVQDKENVLWLVRFYDAWCDKSELTSHIKKYLKNLEDEKYDVNTVLHMSNTFLACQNVPTDLRYSIYNLTKSVSPKNSLKLLYSDKDIYDHVTALIRKKKFDEAIKVVEENKTKVAEDYYYNMAALVYGTVGDHVKAEHYSEEFLKLNPASGFGAFRIGLINDISLSNEGKAIQFYNRAIELGEYKAAVNLGHVYYRNSNWDKALEYYMLAAEHKVTESFMSIATVYFKDQKFDLAEQYTEKAVAANQHSALLNLGLLNEIKGNNAKAEELYKKALGKKLDTALVCLGRLELSKTRPNRKLANDWLTRAVNKRVEGASIELAKAYFLVKKDEKKGIDLLKKESAKGNSSAAHTLAHFYADEGMFDESDTYFTLSYELGRKSAALCHANSILEYGRKEKKQLALKLIEENIDIIKNGGSPNKLMYAGILLWNDEVERSKAIVIQEVQQIREISKLDLDKLTNTLLDSLTDYFSLLVSKGLMKVAYSIFTEMKDVDLKNIIKPVYYALMNYMKEEYPKEYLKAGDELKVTVQEIIERIELMKRDMLENTATSKRSKRVIS